MTYMYRVMHVVFFMTLLKELNFMNDMVLASLKILRNSKWPLLWPAHQNEIDSDNNYKIMYYL